MPPTPIAAADLCMWCVMWDVWGSLGVIVVFVVVVVVVAIVVIVVVVVDYSCLLSVACGVLWFACVVPSRIGRNPCSRHGVALCNVTRFPAR